MKLALNLFLSAAMLALFVWLIWPDPVTRAQVSAAMQKLSLSSFGPYLAGYLALLALVHVCRSLRWHNLLAPLGVRVPTGPMLAIQSVGFMAILALPARLGEFVRPGLLRQRGLSASAALGMVAVERIVDGLLVSLFVFGAFFSLRGPTAPGWMMPTAYAALGVFGAALVFLIAAMRRPAATVRICLNISLLPRIWPRAARVIEEKLIEMIRGLDVLKDQQNLGVFVVWSLVYWLANGFGLWVLARGFTAAGLPELSLVGAFATMGLVAVGITLPNAPGLVGQFQWFTLLGLSLYLGAGAVDKANPLYGLAYAFASTNYVLQVVWYVAMGTLGLLTPWVSLHDMWQARKTGATDPV